MADPRPRVNPGLYWNEITSAAEQRLGAVKTLAYLQESYEREFGTRAIFPRAEFQRLLSLAVGNREAAARLRELPVTNQLTHEHLGATPTAGPPVGLGLEQRYIVPFRHTVLVNGEPRTYFRTAEIIGQLPATKGTLINEVNVQAVQFALKYPDTVHQSIDIDRILRTR